MKIWKVNFKVTGYMEIEVDEDNYNDAINKGLRMARQAISYDGDVECNIQFVGGTAECIDDIDG